MVRPSTTRLLRRRADRIAVWRAALGGAAVLGVRAMSKGKQFQKPAGLRRNVAAASLRQHGHQVVPDKRAKVRARLAQRECRP